ncbi:hypothetical protein [Novosphingobium sp.]|jgi:hypothetical protein|uniref:hypothetical protein n=1 Tax=Novosphingobium sp. TaxID=1874826 RepID=UPI0022C900C3|nr:hypothetical protein [Novosphingobium sp.]MCZ8018984.1 hypothetical protein [Novosphingobium sp.]MCZ8034590.1 hypothetical protein [Novosphingobium sp.]MCZ8052138.1 hypothetical protein [Novosphingobium sp.]MCZ8060064.1 hypothetical protein [Novosphingobium sp.]MCZ8231026.1 hypothetical protein [Novosphingobium sp.]
MANTGTASLTIAELREFASFTPCEQRYIKRSLDVGLGRQDAFKLWARDAEETASIRSQYVVYQELKALRGQVPGDSAFESLEGFMGKLLRVTAFDIAQDRLTCFSAYRFLYERLLGAEVRPFLPSAFCAAAALPQIRPERRKHLLQSISEAAATAPGWSSRAPSFYPEWVEKEAA